MKAPENQLTENVTEAVITDRPSEDTSLIANTVIIGGFDTGIELSLANKKSSIILFISNDEYANLDGIEQLTNLNSLDIAITEISDVDFSPLRQLKNLTSFGIVLVKTNDLDFSPLKSLSNLRKVEIAGLAFTELPDLSGIPSLSRLFIDHTSLTSLKGLEKIPQLEYLHVTEAYEPVTDTSALRYLKKLKGLIFWGGSYAINFNDFKDLPELEYIYIANFGKMDLTGIGRLSQVKKLELMISISEKTGEWGAFRNIEEIGRMTGLKQLLLDELITSVEFLANNTELERLELIAGKDRVDYSKNFLPLDIAPLGNLKKLKRLTIRGFELKNKHVIDSLPELKYFNENLFDLE
jgi:Leucine-rich repeat (LRR) protein